MKLQLCRAYGTLRIALLLVIVALCLFGQTLSGHYGIFCEFQAALLSLQWMLLVSLAVWCGVLLFLTLNLNDLPLISLLLIVIAMYFICYPVSWREPDAIILLFGVTLGKSTFLLLRRDKGGNNAAQAARHSSLFTFLVGLVMLLAFSAWWHLDMANNPYHGPRWMGLWDNPNIYGMLMGAGVVLAIGLLADNSQLKIKNSKWVWFLVIAAGMMGVGLVFSCSRGAWLGTAIGLLYLAKAHRKLKWRVVVLVILAVAAVVILFWRSTADTDPWYLKRLDLSRPSAQHRVSAWRGAIQIMRDHPLGVGWNQAVKTYENNYLPPENGAAAINMNSYLMLGTELGLPALLCFVGYVGLCFRGGRARHSVRAAIDVGDGQGTALPTIQIACRAGALVFVVAFWFDGGLFDLPTAALFWVLLKLGAARQFDGGGLIVDRAKAV